MTAQYVRTKTAQLTGVIDAKSGESGSMKLIFGDEVDVTAAAQGGRTPAVFRGRSGFINEDDLMPAPVLELYFIDVGQGDSTFVVTPARRKILIDGGMGHNALGFLTWKYRLDQPETNVVIDLVVLSHADADHVKGLVPILQHPRIEVRRIVHSGIAKYKKGTFATGLGDVVTVDGREYLATLHDGIAELPAGGLQPEYGDWRDAVAALPQVAYGAVDSDMPPLDVGDPAVTVEVVGPRAFLDPAGGERLLPWLGDEAHTINGDSVVIRLTYGETRVLLAGDVNIPGARWLLDDAACASRLDAHVLKAPHHGSHEFTYPFLQAIAPQIAVVSSGDDTDHGHPRANFLGAIGRAMRSSEPLLFSTELAGNFVQVSGAHASPVPSGSTEEDEEAALPPGAPATLAEVDPASPQAPKQYYQLYKRRLWGMINVRSDGASLYAARRIVAGSWWEAYGPLAPARRP